MTSMEKITFLQRKLRKSHQNQLTVLLIREWITQFTNANHAPEIKERENEKGKLLAISTKKPE